MPTRVWLDLETYSEIDLPVTGLYRYAEDVEITIIGYAIDDEPAVFHDLTLDGELPTPLITALSECQEVWAHNSNFDRVVWRGFWKGKNEIAYHKWRDTMIQAYEHGLPGSLEAICYLALGMPEDKGKGKEGKDLVRLFCKPRPANNKIRRATRETHPDEWARFCEYCRQDVESMREAHRLMPKLNYPNNKDEVQLFLLDQEINDRGIKVDMEFVNAMVVALNNEKQRIKNRICEETNDEVTSATQRDKLLSYILTNYGVYMEKLDKSVVLRELANLDLPKEVRSLLELRQEASKTSTAKYTAIQNAVNADGRVHGMLQFRGANKTGRYAARLIQLQNLPARDVPRPEIINAFIDFTKAGVADMYTGDILHTASYALRGVMIPEEGKKFLVSDWSNIEGRLAAWLAGEHWKLDAFRAFDNGTGHDLYKLAYAKSFKIDVEQVSKTQRQIGKCQELALGYGGGAGAFAIFASGYNIDLKSLANQLDGVSGELLEKADWMWGYSSKNNMTRGLPEDVFKACDVIKQVWRLAHPGISNFWKALEEAMTQCYQAYLDSRNIQPIQVGKHIRMKMLPHMRRLVVELPSKRYLNYTDFIHNPDERKFSYLGTHPVTKRWGRLEIFGGHMLENLCQAISSDILNHTLLRSTKAGLPPVMHVHDEVICEAGVDRAVDELDALMVKGFDWTEGLPLAAEGFETDRYHK